MTNLVTGAWKDGFIPWSFPFDDESLGVPTNVLSRRQFTAANAMLLQCVAFRRRFLSKWWGTADDWNALGYSVPHDADPAYALIGERWIEVFNGAQVAPSRFCAAKSPRQFKSTTEDFERCRSFVKATKADIRIGEGIEEYGVDKKSAWSVPPQPFGSFPNHEGGDYIYLPFASLRWPKAVFYWVTCHELFHNTEPRIGWYPDSFTKELSAEMGAGLLAAALHLEPSADNYNFWLYAHRWIDRMSRDLGWFLRTAGQVQRAVECLLVRAGYLGMHDAGRSGGQIRYNPLHSNA